jgi:hypothetical protein
MQVSGLPLEGRRGIGHDSRVRSFDVLAAEAEAADVSGWGFGWLEGRATEQRPPWGFARLLAARLACVQAALDIDTGGGEVVAEAPCSRGACR